MQTRSCFKNCKGFGIQHAVACDAKYQQDRASWCEATPSQVVHPAAR